MDQTQPAAGVWRDARTQRIRKEENMNGNVQWLIEMRTGPNRYVTTWYHESGAGFVMPDLSIAGYERIIRYSRINT